VHCGRYESAPGTCPAYTGPIIWFRNVIVTGGDETRNWMLENDRIGIGEAAHERGVAYEVVYAVAQLAGLEYETRSGVRHYDEHDLDRAFDQYGPGPGEESLSQMRELGIMSTSRAGRMVRERAVEPARVLGTVAYYCTEAVVQFLARCDAEAPALRSAAASECQKRRRELERTYK